jgi:outer membrane usher protein FimD/PapC
MAVTISASLCKGLAMRLIAALLAALATPVFAEGPTVTGGLGLSLTTEEDSGARENANAYVEAALSGLYAGLSYDIYKDSSLNEVDLYLGYRTTLGTLDVDGSYTRYVYPQDGGDCCGALDLSLGLPMGAFTSGAELTYYPQDKSTETTVSLDYVLPANGSTTLSASYTMNHAEGDRSAEWDLAAAYQLGESSTLAAHLYDGSDYKPYLGVDLTWDFTLMGGGDL